MATRRSFLNRIHSPATVVPLLFVLLGWMLCGAFGDTLAVPFRAPGMVSANQCYLAAAANFFTDTSTNDYNVTAPFEATTVVNISTSAIDVTAFCNATCLVTSATQLPSLILHTWSQDLSVVTINLKANNSIAPMGCSVDSDCQNGTFWTTQWPQYRLGGGAADACAFCMSKDANSANWFCIGYADVYSNGTLFTNTTTCGLGGSGTTFPTASGSATFLPQFLIDNYLEENYRGFQIGWQFGQPTTNQASMAACDAHAKAVFGVNGIVDRYVLNTSECAIGAACNGDYNRVNLLQLRFSSSTRPIYGNYALRFPSFASAWGFRTPSPDNTAATCAHPVDCYNNPTFLSFLTEYWTYPSWIENGQNVTGWVWTAGQDIEAVCINSRCDIMVYTQSGTSPKTPIGWDSVRQIASLQCSYLLSPTLIVDLTHRDLNDTLFNNVLTNPCKRMDTQNEVWQVYSPDCPGTVYLDVSTNKYKLVPVTNTTSVNYTCTLSIYCSRFGSYAYGCDNLQNGTVPANKRGSIYNTFTSFNGYLVPPASIRPLPFSAPGMVTSNACFASAAANAWIDPTLGYNTSAAFEATVISNVNITAIDMNAFCNNTCVVTASANPPTLIEQTFGSTNATLTVKLRANQTAVPISCSVDATCRNGTFWTQQWPAYLQPGNSTDVCARCLNGICVGIVALAANGSVITDTSTCGYDAGAFSPFPVANLLPTVTNEENYMKLYLQRPYITSVTPSQCLQQAALVYGPNSVIEWWNSGSCAFGPMCNADTNKVNVYRLSFGYIAHKVYDDDFASPFGFKSPVLDQTAVTCSRAIDCYHNAVFMAALVTYRSDPYYYAFGQANRTGSAIIVGEAVQPMCLNNRCNIGDYKINLATEPIAPFSWYSETDSPSYKCSYLLTPGTIVDWSIEYIDLNATLFNSYLTNPCQQLDSSQQVLDVYSLDCPGAVILNPATNTWRLIPAANATKGLVSCTLRIQCSAGGVAAYDCDGPRNGSLFNNTRTAIYNTFSTFDGYWNQSQNALVTIPGLVKSYECFRSAQSYFEPTPNTGNFLNTTAPFEIWSEGLSTTSVNISSYCNACKVKPATYRWTLIEHRYQYTKTDVNIYLRANNATAPLACTSDIQCRNNATYFWTTYWPQYNINNSSACVFCIDVICGGIVEVAWNNTPITNTSTCPAAIAAFRAFSAGGTATNTPPTSNDAIGTFDYTTIYTLPVEHTIDNVYKPNSTAANACACRQNAISAFGTAGELGFFVSNTNACTSIATCNGNSLRSQIYNVFVVGGNATVGYQTQIQNTIDWSFLPAPMRYTYTNQGRVSLLPVNSSQPCVTTRDCHLNSAFRTSFDLWRGNAQYYVTGRGTPNLAFGVGGALDGEITTPLCLQGGCHISTFDSTSNPDVVAPIGWDDSTCGPTFKCNYLILPNLTLTNQSAPYDLNTTLFNYIPSNPCRAYYDNVTVLEVYSTDCPGAVIFNSTTNTYQLIAAVPDVFNPNPQPCHLAIRCDTSWSAWAYDCDGPSNTSISTLNKRGAINNLFYVQAPVAPTPPAIMTIPGFVKTYECFRAAQSNLVGSPTDNVLNTTAPFEIWSENLGVATATLDTYCSACTVRQATQRWTLLEHRYSQNQTLVSTYLRSNPYVTPMACTSDSDCTTPGTFWTRFWPQYNTPGANACVFCIDTICGGIAEIAYNNTVITNTSTCPLAIAAFRAADSLHSLSYTTIKTLPIEQTVDNLYRGNFSATPTACGCKQQALLTHGSGGELNVYSNYNASCATIATCNGGSSRIQVYELTVLGGNLTLGYQTRLHNTIDWSYIPAQTGTFVNQGRVSLFANNTAVACASTADCLNDVGFKAVFNAWTTNAHYYIYGRGPLSVTFGAGTAFGYTTGSLCLHGACQVAIYDSTGTPADATPISWDDSVCAPSFRCDYRLASNLTVSEGGSPYDLNQALFNYQWTHPCQAYFGNISALEVYSTDCPGAVIYNVTTSSYQLVPVPPNPYGSMPQMCHLSIRCDVSWSPYAYDCDGPQNVSIATINKRASINNVFFVNATQLPPPVAPVTPPTAPVSPPTAPVSPPTAPVSPPTAPVSPPTEPVSPPTAPVSPPTAPVSPPTAPVSPPTAPVSPPTAPISPPTAPVSPPTAPVSPPTAPVSPPTAPVSPPTAPVSPPTAPVSPPTAPVSPPTAPVSPPTAPVSPPTAPVSPPTAPVSPPTAPVSPPTAPVSPPTEPVSPPTAPVSPPTAPVSPPTAPVSPPTAPVSPPTAPVSPPTAPVSPPTAPVSPPTAPVTPPTAPVSPPTTPVSPPTAPVSPPTPVVPPTAPVTPPVAPITAPTAPISSNRVLLLVFGLLGTTIFISLILATMSSALAGGRM